MKVKVKVPKEIQIGCHIRRIYQAGDAELFGERGVNSPPEEEITVNKRKPLMVQNVNFIHEVLHTINDVWEIGLTEVQVGSIAEGLGQLLFSNMGIELDWSDIPTKTATIKEEGCK